MESHSACFASDFITVFKLNKYYLVQWDSLPTSMYKTINLK